MNDTSQTPCSAVECLAAYLKEHGYDGLYSDECGCLRDDLAPCGNMSLSYCFAGYSDKREARRQGCDFWITPNRPNSVLDRKQANPAGSLPLSDGVLRASALGGEMKGWHYMSEQSERNEVASSALLDGLVFARDILWAENNTPILKLLAHRLQSRYGVDVWALRSPVEGDNATPSNAEATGR